jgi:RimK-like ATP-grasp domain
MKTIYIRGGDAGSAGVLALKHHLTQAGHKIVRSKDKDYDVVVCWGVSMRDNAVRQVPSLNGHVNLFNKYRALELFEKADVRVPVTFQPHLAERFLAKEPLPWFGRRYYHERGKDIQVCKTPRDVHEAVNYVDFFSVYVPNQNERRVWVYKDEALAVYEKEYARPGIDNYKNLEVRSELRDDLLRDRTLTGGAIKAVKALKMDFGAVDVLTGDDGNYYFLEVNSMPDISSNIRVSGIRLANRISRWAEGL